MLLRSTKCNLPIYTLPAPNGRTSVVMSPELVNAVNRISRVLTFNSFLAQLEKCITRAAGRIMQHKLSGGNGLDVLTIFMMRPYQA